MKIIDLLMAPRKAAEAKRLRERQQGTRNAAFHGALDICALVGPEAIRRECTFLDVAATDKAIATAFARSAYNPEAQTLAARGAMEGFYRWRVDNGAPGRIVPPIAP